MEKVYQHREEQRGVIKFLFKCMSKESDPHLLQGVDVFITHEDKCHRLTPLRNNIMCQEVEELSSDHEEEDTRMIAYAQCASEMFPSIIIKSPDTDIVIALNSSLSIRADIYFETGTAEQR